MNNPDNSLKNYIYDRGYFNGKLETTKYLLKLMSTICDTPSHSGRGLNGETRTARELLELVQIYLKLPNDEI